jgi:hypothetical protein
MSETEIMDAVGRLRTRDQVVEMAISMDATITGLRTEIARLRTVNAELRSALALAVDMMSDIRNSVESGQARVDIDYRVGLARTLLDKETTS